MGNKAFLDLIKSRYTVREYKPDVPPLEDLKAILDAACYAPYGGGAEPWKFILLRDRNMIKRLASLPGLDYDFGRYIGGAPAIVVAAWNSASLAYLVLRITGSSSSRNHCQRGSARP